MNSKKAIQKSLRRMAQDPEFKQAFQAQPQEHLAQLLEHGGALPDNRIYRAVVYGLIAIILTVVLGGIAVPLVSVGDLNIDSSLITIASACAGALAGLLAPQPANE